MQNLKFTPDIWAPLSFGAGVREGANVVAVLKEERRRTGRSTATSPSSF